MNQKDLFSLLQKVNVLNYDQGSFFTKSDRLEAIAKILQNTNYRLCNTDGLFRLYAQKPINELPKSLLVVSSHIDCEKHITRCSTQELDEHTLKGTFDNSITNASVLSLMVDGGLPENIVFAFTGDEEILSRGATGVQNYLRLHDKTFFVIVTDVTDMGWNEQCDFTVENNFFGEWEKSVTDAIGKIEGNWMFVPEDPDSIPKGIPLDRVIPEEAEADESWTYDETDTPCFSFCIPVLGEMHGNEGVLVRKKSFFVYTEQLGKLASLLCRCR